MSVLGKIGGPMLKNNLERDGVDLAFENGLIYLDVNNMRVGINNSFPAEDFDVVGSAIFNHNLKIDGTTITSENANGNITISPNGSGLLKVSYLNDTNVLFSGASGEIIQNANITFNTDTLTVTKTNIGEISIANNVIGSINTNGNIELSPNGSGLVVADRLAVLDLTPGRLVFVDANNKLVDNANLLFDGTTLTINSTVLFDNAQLGDISINGTTITSVTTNSDLNIQANGSGNVVIDSLQITETSANKILFTDTNNIVSTDNVLSYDEISKTLSIGNIDISNNEIEVVDSNGNLNITTNGTGSILLNSTSTLLLPAGSSSDRPIIPQAGMIRWNTTIGELEYFDGLGWLVLSSNFTTISSDLFNGDASTLQFELSQASTTAGVIVSINGVIQKPTTAYTVTSNILTFTEAPLSTDVIEARTVGPIVDVSRISDGNSSIGIDSYPNVVAILDGNVALTLNAQDATFTGNVSGSNLSTSGNVTASFFIGNGSQLTGLSAGSIISNGNSNVVVAANANVTVSVAGNTNIFTVTGTGANIAGSANVTGNANVGNLGTSGNVTASFFIGNGSQLTGITAGSVISNGNSNVTVAANANVTVSVAGNSNVVSINGTGANILGALSVTGNANVGNLGTSGNVTASFFIGNGSQLTGLPGGTFISNGNSNVTVAANANVTVSVAGNTNVFTITGTGANIAGTVNVTGNANVGNLGTSTAIITTGNITTINSGLLQNGNSNVTIATNSNITLNAVGGERLRLTATGANVSGTFNVTGNANTGNLGTTTLVATNLNSGLFQNGNSNVTIAANGNVTINAIGSEKLRLNSTGANVSGTLNVTGNANVSNLGTGRVIATGNISATQLISNVATGTAPFVVTSTTQVANLNVATAGTATTATTADTVTTAAQPNITSIGTLTTLTVSGNANTGNLGTTTLIATTGNITTINSGLLQNGNSNVTIAANGNVTINAVGGERLRLTATGANISGTVNATGNANVGNLGTAQVLATANIIAPQLISNVATGTAPFVVTSTTQVANLNVATAGTATTATSATTAGTVTTAAQPNITSVGSLSSLAVSGNANVGNLGTAGLITATGNVSGGNLTTSGVVNATGNITTSGFFIGDGSQLSNLTITAGSSIINGNSNVAVAANANVVVSVAGNASILTVTGTGANISGTFNVTGNANVGNLSSAGLITSTGNLSINSNFTVNASNGNTSVAGTLGVTGATTLSSTLNVVGNANVGNLGTLGIITATGNVSGGNLTTTGVVAATGNVSGGNLTTTGALSVTGNANVGNLGTATAIITTGNITTINSGLLQNGNSNVAITTNGNVTVNAVGSERLRLTATGANVSGTFNVTGNANTGNLGTTTLIATTGNITTINSGLIQNGNSNVAIVTNGNVTISVTGTANVINVQTANVSFAANVLPTANATYSLGSSSNRWANVWGVASSALYADLAERYAADIDYEPGTVVVFGGKLEITVTNKTHDTRIAGVISTSPAYLMNDQENQSNLMLPVALQGKVPTKVRGPVNKGDLLVASGECGVAKRLDDNLYKPGCVIGKSLEDYEDYEIKVIEVVIGRF